MKHVVTHHALHAEEGVYRLAFAEAHEEIVHDYVPDPDVPEMIEIDGKTVPNPACGVVLVERSVTVLGQVFEVVWAADDERWDGMSDEGIADTQMREVRAVVRWRERGAIEREAAEREAEQLGTRGLVL